MIHVAHFTLPDGSHRSQLVQRTQLGFHLKIQEDRKEERAFPQCFPFQTPFSLRGIPLHACIQEGTYVPPNHFHGREIISGRVNP